MADHYRMIEELTSADTCNVCHTAVERDQVCHVYKDGVQVTLCGARCAEHYMLHEEYHGSRSGRSVVEEILAERRWRDFGL